ncbi:hypothetical protein Tco_0199764 [Tanacetum coccineum]
MQDLSIHDPYRILLKSAISHHNLTDQKLHLKMILEKVNNNVGELVASPLVIKPAYTNALEVATPSSYAPKGLPDGALT